MLIRSMLTLDMIINKIAWLGHVLSNDRKQTKSLSIDGNATNYPIDRLQSDIKQVMLHKIA